MKSPKAAAVASKSGVQLSVSIRRPLILLARPVPTPNGEMQKAYCYGFKQACKLTGAHTVGSPQPRFVLPDINKLSTEFKSDSLAVLLVHLVGAKIGNRRDIIC